MGVRICDLWGRRRILVLCISSSTFYDWWAKGTAPRCIKLPNGEIRVRRTELDRWLAAREESD